MGRIPPKPSVVKKLFALSGNQCSFPRCKNEMVNSAGSIIGEICHIEAAEKGGERYNSEQTDEQRRSFGNLILLCPIDHIRTNDVKKFTVEVLRKMKAKHIKKLLNKKYEVSGYVVNQSIQKFMKQKNKNTSSGTQINNQVGTQNIETQMINNYGGKDTIDKKLKIEGTRKVINELKKVIDEFRQVASPPGTTVIDFKNELIDRNERKIETVPHAYLKFRKENGRIKSDVESYEKVNQIELIESDSQTQIILRSFLAKSDPEKKQVLKQQIKHKGQLQPAIITCDGFLINGNRRKMILEELYEETDQNSRYENMRVVILPENVTELDISRIENRYQMQDEGKSEYSGLNRALTIRNNINKGYELRAQLKDDPKFANKDDKEFAAEVRRIEKSLLKPLELVDRYLKTFNREKLYNTVSEGSGDKSGRWQAFIDYSLFYNTTLLNKQKRLELAIKEEEIGLIDNAILKIIRKRELKSKELEKNLGKVHAFVRGGNLKKYLQNQVAKKHILTIAKKVKGDIPESEKTDKDKKPYSEKEIDEKWSNKFQSEILGNLMQAYKAVHNQEERDKPLDLLEDALKKLNHDNLKIENMGTEHYTKALSLTKRITTKANVIYEAVDKARYNLKRLNKKGKE